MYETITRKFIAFALAVACCLCSTAVVAQQPSNEQQRVERVEEEQAAAEAAEYFMSEEHRQEIYSAKRRSPGKAVLWTLAFPGLGNIYAEQYLIAGLAFVAMTFAAVFASYGLATKQPRIAVTGAIVAVGAYGVGIGTSVAGVYAFNRQLRQGLKIQQASVSEMWTPMVSFRF